MQVRDQEPVARWRACPPDDLVWVSLDEDFVVYHRPSGKTHFLNAASHYLISELLHEPRTLVEVCEAFSAATPVAASPQMARDELCQLLEHLDRLGLIHGT